jgi:hypothetical protein
MVTATLSAASRGGARSRVSWWRELALLAALYGVYMLARALVGVHPAAAMDRGRWLLDLEASARIDIERPLNSAVHAVPLLAVLADYVYASLHYLVTPIVLVWFAVRHRDGYRRGRNALLIATALGLIGFWLFPTAPPRLLDAAAFLDTMAVFSDWGWWGEAASAPRGMEGLSNQYAALPSLHVGWALWCALQVRANTSSRLLRRWAWTYPALITLVVMATANHYLLDAVAGAAVVLVGHALASRLRSVRSFHQSEGHAGDVGVVVHGSALPRPVPAMRLAPVLDVDEPLPFGVGEVPRDIGELDDLDRGDLDDAERLPVAV